MTKQLQGMTQTKETNLLKGYKVKRQSAENDVKGTIYPYGNNKQLIVSWNIVGDVCIRKCCLSTEFFSLFGIGHVYCSSDSRDTYHCISVHCKIRKFPKLENMDFDG